MSKGRKYWDNGKYWEIFNINRKIIDIGCWLLSFIRLPQYIASSRIRGANKNIKFTRKSEKCYICGNGPSLKNVDFKRIKDDDIIVVNKFYKFAKEKNIEITPTFYCLIDDAFYRNEFIEDTKLAFQKYPSSAFLLNGKYIENIKQHISNLKSTFFAFMWKESLNNKTTIDFTKRIPIANNVINTAIALAIYAGYKEIFLIGCDFNSFSAPKSLHCYKEKEKEKEMSLSFELFNYALVAEDHIQLDNYANRNGVKIYNATPGSLIDAYERIDLELTHS